MYVGMPYALAAIAISSACGPAGVSTRDHDLPSAYGAHTIFLRHYTTSLQFLKTVAFN